MCACVSVRCVCVCVDVEDGCVCVRAHVCVFVLVEDVEVRNPDVGGGDDDLVDSPKVSRLPVQHLVHPLLQQSREPTVTLRNVVQGAWHQSSGSRSVFHCDNKQKHSATVLHCAWGVRINNRVLNLQNDLFYGSCSDTLDANWR